MPQYKPNKQPEAYQFMFLEAVRKAPGLSLVPPKLSKRFPVEGHYTTVLQQRCWALFLRSLRERPEHSLSIVLQKYQPRASVYEMTELERALFGFRWALKIEWKTIQEDIVAITKAALAAKE